MISKKTTCISLSLYLIIHVCRCEFVTESKYVTYFVGETAELNCTLKSLQKDKTYYWIRDNEIDFRYISRDTEILSRDLNKSKYRVCRCGKTYTLQISDLKYEDAAKYYCYQDYTSLSVNVNRTTMQSKSQTLVLNVVSSRKWTVSYFAK